MTGMPIGILVINSLSAISKSIAAAWRNDSGSNT
jgi:hypothetical protein